MLRGVTKHNVVSQQIRPPRAERITRGNAAYMQWTRQKEDEADGLNQRSSTFYRPQTALITDGPVCSRLKRASVSLNI